MARKFILIVLVCVALVGASGCIIPAYSGDPIRRNRQLLYSSEGLRVIHDEWERFWLLDQPNHMTPYRTHGGMI